MSDQQWQEVRDKRKEFRKSQSHAAAGLNDRGIHEVTFNDVLRGLVITLHQKVCAVRHKIFPGE